MKRLMILACMLLTTGAWAETEAVNELDTAEVEGKTILPVFGKGEYPDAFVVYQDPMYDFVLDGKGAGLLYLKDEKGQVIKPPLRLGGLGLSYRKKGAKLLTSRAMVSINERNLVPVRNPMNVRFSGVAEDGVTFTRAYTFARGTIRADFGSRDPDGLQPPTMTRTGVQSLKIKSGGTAEEAQKLFESWKAVFDTAAGRVECDYWQSMAGRNRVKSATLKGPWGPREVRIEFDAPAALLVYNGMPLHSGFGLMSQAEVKKKGDQDRKLGIKVIVK